MKLKWSKPVIAALAAATTLVISGCKSGAENESGTLVAAERGVPGGVLVETMKVSATVTAKDATTRKLTLTTRDGKKHTFKAGSEVVNFPQIEVGDTVTATVTEELVVFMASEAPRQDQGAAAMVALRPVGAKPGGLVAETVQIKAKVTAIDLKHRKATLEFPDGSTHRFAVRDDIDLTQRTVGEQVIIRATESVVVTVDKS